jgi:hypothetical protein
MSEVLAALSHRDRRGDQQDPKQSLRVSLRRKELLRLAVRPVGTIGCVRRRAWLMHWRVGVEDAETFVNEQHLERPRREWIELVRTGVIIEVNTDEVKGLLELSHDLGKPRLVHTVKLHRELIDSRGIRSA